MDRIVELKCGDRNVPLKNYVKETNINVVLGLVAPLKGVDTDEDIVVTIKKKGDGS